MAGKDMFRTTFRNTMQGDTPFYRDKLEPYNVKHALVDPSHTFNQPLYHSTRKNLNLLGYDSKNGMDKTVRQIQHERRETVDFSGKNIMRLPERRDYIGEESDPVVEYYRKRDANKKFFRLRSEEKVDLSQFGKTNYITSPSAVVGMTRHKNYLTSRKVADFIDEKKEDKKQRYVFDDKLKTSKSMTDKDRANRELTVEKFKLMKKIISNEKKVSNFGF